MNTQIKAFVATAVMASSGMANAATYSQTALVSAAGGDYTSPNAAMADLANWCGTPSDSNRCLIKLLPGTYDVGSSTFQLQPYVSLIGSGREVTTVTDSGAGVTIETADETELADLHVEAGLDLHSKITGVTGRGLGVYIHDISINVPRPATNFTHGLDIFGVSSGGGLGGKATVRNIEITMNNSVSGDNSAIRSVNEVEISGASINVVGGRISRGIHLGNANYFLNDARIVMDPNPSSVRTTGLSLNSPFGTGHGTASNVHSYVYAENSGGDSRAVFIGVGSPVTTTFLNNVYGESRLGNAESVGLRVDGSIVHVANSTFSGESAAVKSVNAASKSLLTRSTLLKNGVVNTGTPISCTAITDDTNAFHASGCP